MDNDIEIRAQAAAFRSMIEHLQKHPEIQNIDLMTVAGFCRNCLTKWYAAGMETSSGSYNIETAQEMVYGMPYQQWKKKHQTEATAEQLEAYAATQKKKSINT